MTPSMMKWVALVAASTALFFDGASAAALQQRQSSSSLPVVDLGYERQQATSFNQTGDFYNFANIRYAAPPTGDLRFRAPQKPQRNRAEVQTGLTDRICAQSNPAWLGIASQFIPLYLQGQTEFNESSFNTSSGGGLPQVDPRTTEDCLFLDVVVPKEIFDNRNSGSGAAVLVWIYGGGYTGGDKSGSGSPAGLIKRSTNRAATGVIYVSMNYRLGAFGFLSGPTFQSDGDANAGLLDQRFALEWVQKHISKFGGDPSRVTVFGESAGGGSIMHQITAYGGTKGPAPFQQAVPQSPGFFPYSSEIVQEDIFNSYLGLLNVSSIAEARELSFTELATANAIQVGGSPYGQFTYGPTVDGDFAPALPGQLLLHGQFDKDVKVMVGHNADEGLLFTSPFIQNNTAFRQQVLSVFPNLVAFPSILRYIIRTLYPPIFDGSQAQNYTNQIARADALTSELIFTCNTFYLDTAYNNETYAYYFTVPPALHGQDIPYTYFNGPDPENVPNPRIAIALQEYITSFAMDGNPNERGVPFFPMYGNDATVQELSATGIDQLRDPTANARCVWWQKGLFQ